MWSDTISGDFVHPWYDLDGDGDLDDILEKYKTALASLCFGTGGVISTAGDLARWIKYLFEGGFLTQESLDQMLTFEAGWYGLGVMSFSFFNREFWGHSGWSPGYKTVVAYSPVDSISIAVLSNDDNVSRTAISLALLEVVYAFNHPQLLFDVTRLDLGNISSNVAMFDTSFFVYNTGGATDSVFASIYSGTADSNAFSVLPSVFKLAPGDSQAITYKITPNLLAPKRYTTWLTVKSKFSPSTPSLSKSIKFKIIVTAVDNAKTDMPTHITLKQNYPNPFNASTVFSYQLPVASEVELTIYSITGQKISTLVSEQQQAGIHRFEWDGSDLASGVYFYRLAAGNFQQTKKLILLK